MVHDIHYSDFISEQSWSVAKEAVKKTNVELYNVINELSPADDLTLFRIKYPFGANILDKGTLCLPDNQGNAIRCHDHSLKNKLQDKISLDKIPLIFSLNKYCEVFMDMNGRPVPLNMIGPGEFLGLFENLKPQLNEIMIPVCVTSGARTTFMLPKISDTNAHKRLHRKYAAPAIAPFELQDQWHTFKKIAASESVDERWTTDIIIFTDKWLELLSKDKTWALFQNYLYKLGWKQTQHLRDNASLSSVWSILTQVISDTRLKVSPYHIDTIRHLTTISVGGLPAFKPADQNEAYLPSRAIQDAYLDTYGLKDHLPIIMHPHMLRGHLRSLSYYSLLLPTLLEGSYLTKGSNSFITELNEIRLIMNTFMQKIKNLEHIIPEKIRNTCYEYFHSQASHHDGLQSTIVIPEKDTEIQELNAHFDNRTFPNLSPFARCCIRLSTSPA